MAINFRRSSKNPLDIDEYNDVVAYSSTCECGKDDYMFTFENKPSKGLTTFTSGKTFRWHGYDLDLMFVTSNPASSMLFPQILYAVVSYFIDRNPKEFKKGGVTRNLGPIDPSSPELTAFYIMHSTAFNNKLVEAEFMQVAPISPKELKYIEVYGGEALEKHFHENNVDLTDFRRACSLKDIKVSYADQPGLEYDDDPDNPYLIDLPNYGEVLIELTRNIPFEGITTYECSNFTEINPAAFTKGALVASSNAEEAVNVPFVMLNACLFFFENPDLFKPGYATPSLGKIEENSSLTSIYVSHAHWYTAPQIHQSFLMFTPISDSELAYLDEHGAEKFEEHLFSGNVNVFDFARDSSI